jgi:hypothetical protein
MAEERSGDQGKRRTLKVDDKDEREVVDKERKTLGRLIMVRPGV